MTDAPGKVTGRRGVRPALWFGLVAAVAVLVGVQWLQIRQPQPLLEVDRKELTLRENRLYRGSETRPYRGAMLERYPDGNLQSRSLIADGVLHGLSEGWSTNRQIQVREHFNHGVSHGLRTKWHSHGGKQSEVMIVSGKLEGLFQRWHEDGALAERMQMRQGQPDGTAESFYPSSFLKARATLREGRLVSQQNWADGERKADSILARAN